MLVPGTEVPGTEGAGYGAPFPVRGGTARFQGQRGDGLPPRGKAGTAHPFPEEEDASFTAH